MGAEGLTVGLLHPGAMGAAVGAVAVSAGARVLWLPSGRGPATVARAEAAGLEPAPDLAALVRSCSLILSICPPAAASQVARLVAESAYAGVYVEANAVSPGRAERIAALFGTGPVTTVDGGIVGPPPRRPGSTRLYLSGPEQAVAVPAELFAGTRLAPVVLPGPVGRASALKLAFASYNKLSQVLAAQAYALAYGHGVGDELRELAGATLPDTPLAQPERLADAAARAWRWEPEFREMVDACVAAGLPGEFAGAAADLLRRWSRHKDDASVPLDRLIAELRQPPARPDGEAAR
jgi:3-hydroxyisobutyrate dehydrogenase-like beta-hydroxyacid dehydrogenase